MLKQYGSELTIAPVLFFVFPDITSAACHPRLCKRRVPFPTFDGWVIIPRRNPAGRKLLALIASVGVVLDKRAYQRRCSV